MMEQTPQTVNEPVNSTGCCPPFDPAQWDEKEIVWHDKKFVTDHILSLFHMPLTLNGRVKKNGKLIINAGADIPDYLMLIDENSKWGAEMYIEVLKDVSSGLAPLTKDEASKMIRSLKSYGIIKGVRGQEGVNEEIFADIVVRLSALVTVAPEIFEMDLNPLLGKKDKVVAVDARIRIEK